MLGSDAVAVFIVKALLVGGIVGLVVATTWNTMEKRKKKRQKELEDGK